MQHFDLRWLFKPTTVRQKTVKWIAIILANVVGISAFVSLVLDISYLQRICREGVYVDAVISAKLGNIWNNGSIL